MRRYFVKLKVIRRKWFDKRAGYLANSTVVSNYHGSQDELLRSGIKGSCLGQKLSTSGRDAGFGELVRYCKWRGGVHNYATLWYMI